MLNLDLVIYSVFRDNSVCLIIVISMGFGLYSTRQQQLVSNSKDASHAANGGRKYDNKAGQKTNETIFLLLLNWPTLSKLFDSFCSSSVQMQPKIE